MVYGENFVLYLMVFDAFLNLVIDDSFTRSFHVPKNVSFSS